MLTGFETETQPLTDAEEKLFLPVLIRGFINHIGKDKAIKEGEISKQLAARDMKLQGSRFRKIVNHIRRNNLIPGYMLLSSSEGYWLSNDQEEIKKCIKSIRERGESILWLSEAMENSLNTIPKQVA